MISSLLKAPWKVLAWLSAILSVKSSAEHTWGTNQIYWQRIATAKTLRKRASPTLRNPQSTLELDARWKISWRCKRERNRVQHVSLSLHLFFPLSLSMNIPLPFVKIWFSLRATMRTILFVSLTLNVRDLLLSFLSIQELPDRVKLSCYIAFCSDFRLIIFGAIIIE